MNVKGTIEIDVAPGTKLHLDLSRVEVTTCEDLRAYLRRLFPDKDLQVSGELPEV